MATNKDWQVLQSTMLYKLLKLQSKDDSELIKKTDLNDLVGEIKAAMSKEEIAHVEEQVKLTKS